MISPLPYWALTNPQPAFLESESGSVIEQTAIMYAKVNELVTEYNSFTENINAAMKEFLVADKIAKEEHMTAIRQEFQDFINVIDLKIRELEKDMSVFQNDMTEWKNEQQKIINDAANYMRYNIVETTQNIVENALENETINAKLNYDETTESLSLVLSDSEV